MKSLMELKCPRCGAELEAEEDREVLYCQYCGAKIFLTDENTFTINKTIHTIDDADITRAETDRMVQMHKIELDKRRARREAIVFVLTAFLKILASFFLICSAIYDSNKNLMASVLWIAGLILIWNIKYLFKK